MKLQKCNLLLNHVTYFTFNHSCLPLLTRRLCRKSAQGSRRASRPAQRAAGLSRASRSSFESLRRNGESKGSPRRAYGTLRNNRLAVRPERVEWRTTDYDSVSRGGRIILDVTGHCFLNTGRGGPLTGVKGCSRMGSVVGRTCSLQRAPFC